ncbi:MAG: hypothetical protein AB7S26_01235 [Sandaracinaceae bacterium]
MNRWMMTMACAALVGCAVDPTSGDEGISVAHVRAETTSMTGSSTSSGSSWTTHSVVVTQPGTLTATLSWPDASANANLFVYDPTGAMLAFANGTTDNPEVVSADADMAGTYVVGVKCKTGRCDYTLDVTVEAPTIETTFVGSMSASSGSWLVQPFELRDGEHVDVELRWDDPSADLNVFLYSPDGDRPVIFANGTADRPERLSWDADVTGDWRIGIKCKTGASAYELVVTIRDQDEGGPTPDPVPEPEPLYPGQPDVGSVYWGAAITGNGDPVTRHENAAGAPITIHRTFWQWSARTGNLVTTAEDDVAHGRLPWVSVKTPSWVAMGRGDYDAQIDQMLTALDAIDGPVWLTIHHEPEGGGGVNAPDDPGGPSAHIAMNRRVRERMTALGTDNIALAPILMTYTWNARSGRDPEQWWAPGIYDFLGVDHYRDSEATLLDTQWAAIRSFAGAHGVDVAVGEWGMRGTNAAAGARVHEWYDAAIGSATDGLGGRVVGLCAFDSGLNSPNGSWELTGGQLTAFRELMRDPRTASILTP